MRLRFGQRAGGRVVRDEGVVEWGCGAAWLLHLRWWLRLRMRKRINVHPQTQEKIPLHFRPSIVCWPPC